MISHNLWEAPQIHSNPATSPKTSLLVRHSEQVFTGDSDIFLGRSTDKGATWKSVVQLSNTGNAQSFGESGLLTILDALGWQCVLDSAS